MHRTQEKYLRMCACENISWRHHLSNVYIFEKTTPVCHRCQKTTENSVFILQGILQRKSTNIFVVVVMDFWWVNQSPTKSRLSLHENFKEDRTYCIISRLCKLFMSKLCNLRFFFWSNVGIWFTFSNSSWVRLESLV